MRILIVEDEVRLAGTLADMVAQDGYTADTAHDGDSGLGQRADRRVRRGRAGRDAAQAQRVRHSQAHARRRQSQPPY